MFGRSGQFVIHVYPRRDQQYSVDGWAHLALTTDYLEISRSCRVRKLLHLKSTRHFRHEYLLIEVDVVVGKCTKIGILVIDRNPGTSKVDPPKNDTSIDGQIQPKPLSNKRSFTLSSVSIPTSLRSSASSASRSCTGDLNASDRVIVPASGDPKQLKDLLRDEYEVLCTLELPSDIFPLAELAALLTVVSDYKEEYTALDSQCYWYILAVYTAIHHRWPHCKEKQLDHYSDKGKFMGVGVATSMDVEDLREIRSRWTSAVGRVSGFRTMREVRLCGSISHLLIVILGSDGRKH
jgi:hypothetical protein